MALTDKLSAIGDAIREKNGSTTTYTLAEMPGAILAIEGGSDSEVITDLFTLTGDSRNMFNTSSNKLKSVISKHQALLATNKLTNGDYAFYGHTITTAPNLHLTGSETTVQHMFDKCANLTNIPEISLGYIGDTHYFDYTFANCTGLTEIPKFELTTRTTTIDSSNTVRLQYTFSGCTGLETVGDVFIRSKDIRTRFTGMFQGCTKLESVGTITAKPYTLVSMFQNCHSLRETPVFAGSVDTLYDTHYDYYTDDANRPTYSANNALINCCSLRTIRYPFNNVDAEGAGTRKGLDPNLLQCAFAGCHTLDEITNLYVGGQAYETNCFEGMFANCYRVKEITFQPSSAVHWINQCIDLSSNVGYGLPYSISSAAWSDGTYYNSGITLSKRVTNKTTYDALKDDPDWWSTSNYYSRYDRASAINTINSLPDTTWAGGGGNVIKFNSDAGYQTDGGKIGDLSAEQIAVAEAKGWTVAFA